MSGGELRVSLSSPLDPGQGEGYRCPLYRADQPSDVAEMLPSNCPITTSGLWVERDPLKCVPSSTIVVRSGNGPRLLDLPVLRSGRAGVVAFPVNLLSRDKFEVAEIMTGAVLLYRGKTAVLPGIDEARGA